MGFALWLDDELAWAQGTHEYRPMGTAVIHAGGVIYACERLFPGAGF